MLFDPSPLGIEAPGGVAAMMDGSVNACDIDVRRELLHNVVLSGGTTMLSGIAAR
jgi:actin-related protein